MTTGSIGILVGAILATVSLIAIVIGLNLRKKENAKGKLVIAIGCLALLISCPLCFVVSAIPSYEIVEHGVVVICEECGKEMSNTLKKRRVDSKRASEYSIREITDLCVDCKEYVSTKEDISKKSTKYYNKSMTREEKLQNEDFTNSEINRIMEGTIAIGDFEAVVLESWGKPKDINRTTTLYGTSEQWVYGLGCYVYLNDGIVTSIQN